MKRRHFRLLAILAAGILVSSAQCAIEIYQVKASPYVPAFIDYRLNCPGDVTISILPSDAEGNPTGAAIKTVTMSGQSRGTHRYIWMADMDDGTTAPRDAWYVAELSATTTQTGWNPIVGLFTNIDPFHEYAPRPLPSVPDMEGFHSVAVNNNPATGQYYGRIYAPHKVNKAVYMYEPDGTYIGEFHNPDGTPFKLWSTSSAPWDVSVADDGYVYVADRTNMVIYCFDPNGKYVSVSPTTTNHRAIFARTDLTSRRTYVYFSGAAAIRSIWVEADHTTWQTSPFAGDALFTCGTMGSDNYGMWVNPARNVAYVASIAGTMAGVTRWTYGTSWTQDAAFNRNYTGAGSTDVSFVDADTDFLWVSKMVNNVNDNTDTTQNERTRAMQKVDPATGAITDDDFDVVVWGLSAWADGVGNVATSFGKSTASWCQRYWGLFARPGTNTCTDKRSTAFYMSSTPAPVVVPDSAVWTPDNIIAADDVDSASVSFKVMDVDGWEDITSTTLDLRPLGYGEAEVCILGPDVTDASGKTAIATHTAVKAKVGARATDSFGQLPHYLAATVTDAAGGSTTDPTEVELSVSGHSGFAAYVSHSVLPNWYIEGAQIAATGGGIAGTTDPRATGPFVYTSVPADSSGYAALTLSSGSFDVVAKHVSFGSQAPVSFTAPYTDGTINLKLRPYTIAELRSGVAPYATKVNVQGVCFAQPQGLAPTAAPGISGRTDSLIMRNQWYMCDANTPAEGMLFLVSKPSATFEQQWDDSELYDMFGNSLYFGKRPAIGETIMVTGTYSIPAGHERRVLVEENDINLGQWNFVIERTYLNRGNLGGLPTTPVSMTLPDFSHPMATGSSESWGKYGQTEVLTVLGYQADGVQPGITEPYDKVPFLTVANAAGDTAQVAIDLPTTLGVTEMPSIGSMYAFRGAAGRRVRQGNGCIRIARPVDLLPSSASGLRVAVEPAEAVTADAKWRRLGTETWLNPGSAEILPPGEYTVEFKSIPGWAPAANVPVTVSTGMETSVIGIYTQSLGSLRVTIQPAEVVAAGAQWRRVGTETWFNSGDTESGIPSFEYFVEFKEVDGWITPEPVPVAITDLDTVDVLAVYASINCSILVTIEPADAVDAGAQWRRTGTITWMNSGDMEYDLAPGTYTIEFKDLPAWIVPPETNVVASLDQAAEVTATYRPGEDFESGGLLEWPWQTGGNAAWQVATDSVNGGIYSARAGAIGDGGMSYLEITLIRDAGTVSFYRRVSSEVFDPLRFKIDGVEKAKVSGDRPWAQQSYSVSAGLHTYRWEYTKDGSTSEGEDTAWIDDIEFPSAYPVPVIAGITPTSGICTGPINTAITGSGFVGGSAVRLVRAGQPDIPGTVSALTPTEISCVFNLAGAAVGSWDVAVTIPDGQTAVLAGGFTVRDPMVVTGITPEAGLNTGSWGVTIAGTGFMEGVAIRLERAGEPDIEGTDVQLAGPDSIVCSFDLAGRTLGSWDVVVANPDGQASTLPTGFTICRVPPTPIVTDDGDYTGNLSALHASWTLPEPDSDVVEYEYCIMYPDDPPPGGGGGGGGDDGPPSPPGFLAGASVVSWQSAGSALEATETGLSLEVGQTYIWGVRARNRWGFLSYTGISDGIVAVRGTTIAEAKNQFPGSLVLISDAVVTSTASEFPGLWLMASDRSAGLRVPESWATTRGDRLQIVGTVQWSDGIPVLTGGVLESRTSGPALKPLSIGNLGLAPDLRETLNYNGVNPVGLLVTTWGKVTRVDTVSKVFYVNDGANLADGMGPSIDPFIGIRVAYTTGITPPATGKYVLVTGIRSVQPATLVDDAFVNGKYRLAGDLLYLPVIVLRSQSDIVIRK